MSQKIFGFYQFKTPFYIFGSENSKDWDVLVSVDYIPQNIDAAHEICKEWNSKLSTFLKEKTINSNLAVFEGGRITKVFKGTADELNNVLFYTYKNHKQFFVNPILNPVTRDVDLKILRCARFIITFFSRTHLRTEIKSALRGNLIDKLEVLKKIDFEKMEEFVGKKEEPEDIRKVLAFQYGQVFSLIDGHEPDSYTKNGIIKNYPNLKNLLSRTPVSQEDLKTLNEYNERFIKLIEQKLSSIRLVEY